MSVAGSVDPLPSEWAYLRLDLSAEVRRGVEEKVSNEVATNVLMPWADGALHARDVHPADVMAGLFATTRASRSAVLQRLKAQVAGSRRACRYSRVQTSTT